MLCTTCQSNTIEQLQRNASSKAKGSNGNIVGGIVGALLGSLLGLRHGYLFTSLLSLRLPELLWLSVL